MFTTLCLCFSPNGDLAYDDRIAYANYREVVEGRRTDSTLRNLLEDVEQMWSENPWPRLTSLITRSASKSGPKSAITSGGPPPKKKI